MEQSFTQRIAARLLGGRAPAVVGLDPRTDALPTSVAPDASPERRITAFYQEVMPLLAERAVAVKPNIAFFEAHGAAGYAAYEETCAMARAVELPVIGDIKRGDIGSTAAAYAEAHFRHADALTLHPYLGAESIEPFLRVARETGGAVFVLVRTSNPSAGELQDLRIGEDSLSERVADAVERWAGDEVDEYGFTRVGAVVGATYPEQVAHLRQRMPRAWLLIPGVGAQGGSIRELLPAFDGRGLGALVNQSRGVLQCFQPDDADWRDRIESALDRFCSELREVAREC